MIIFYYKLPITKELVDFPRLNFVLSGFILHLASHFGKSSSNHSYGYYVSNDLPNCIASYNLNSGSLVQFAG